MEIIGSPTSPFVRIVRALAMELGLDFHFNEINSMLTPTEEDTKLVNENNPLMKIPILKDGDKTIIESRIMCNYLIKKAKNQGKTFEIHADLDDEDELNLSTIYGVADSVLLIFLLDKFNGIHSDEGYLGRSKKRIIHALEYLNNKQDIGKNFGVTELVLICTLTFITRTEVYDWSHFDHLVSVYDKYKARDSFKNVGISA